MVSDQCGNRQMQSINEHWDHVILSVEKQVKSITRDKIFYEIEQKVSDHTYQCVFDRIWLPVYKEITRFIYKTFRKQS